MCYIGVLLDVAGGGPTAPFWYSAALSISLRRQTPAQRGVSRRSDDGMLVFDSGAPTGAVAGMSRSQALDVGGAG